MALVREWTGAQARERRLKLEANQADFWGRVLATQSGGSRYEGGRPIPPCVQALLTLAYGTDLQRSNQYQAVSGIHAHVVVSK